MSEKSEIPVIKEITDQVKQLFVDYKRILNSADDEKRTVVKAEIEALLQDSGDIPALEGKILLINYHLSFLGESKDDYSNLDEEAYLKKNDDYYGHRHQVTLLANDIASITGMIPEVTEDDPLKEDLAFILSNESINATGTLNRSLCSTGGSTIEYFEVINYLNIQTDGGGSIVLFEDDLKQLLDIVQTANRQTSGRFKLDLSTQY